MSACNPGPKTLQLAQPGGADANAAEDKLQRQLAKKLGLKSKRGTMGGDDGLDDLVGGLDSLGPSDSNGGVSAGGSGDDDSSGSERGSDAFPEDIGDSQDALGSGELESGSDGGAPGSPGAQATCLLVSGYITAWIQGLRFFLVEAFIDLGLELGLRYRVYDIWYRLSCARSDAVLRK